MPGSRFSTGKPPICQKSVAVAPGLAAAIHAIEQFWRQAHDGRDIDDGAVLASGKSWDGGVGKAGEGGHVEGDHFGHALDITFQQAGVGADACVVHEQADAGVFTQFAFYLGEVICLG